MKKIKTSLLGIAFLGLALTVSGQQPVGSNNPQRVVNQYKAQIICETAHYLAEDSDEKPSLNLICDEATETKIVAEVSNKKLPGKSIDFIRNLFKRPVTNTSQVNGDKNSLQGFAEEIFTTLETNKPERRTAQKYLAYKGRVNRQLSNAEGALTVALNNDIASSQPVTNAQPNNPETPTAEADTPTLAATENYYGGGELSKTTEMALEPMKKQLKEQNAFNKMMYIFLGALALGLLLTWFVMYQKLKPSRNRRAAVAPVPAPDNSRAVDQLSSRVNSDIDALRAEITDLKNRLQQSDARIREMVTIIEEERQALHAKSAAAAAPVVAPEPAPEVPAEPQIVKRFAMYADSPEGFSNSVLSDYPTNESVFELTLDGENRASYEVVQNPEAQQYALNNNLLRSACEYDNSPASEETVIQTIVPGQLEKNGPVWRIVKKAQISFI